MPVVCELFNVSCLVPLFHEIDSRLTTLDKQLWKMSVRTSQRGQKKQTVYDI